jgi:hypothetical protein
VLRLPPVAGLLWVGQGSSGVAVWCSLPARDWLPFPLRTRCSCAVQVKQFKRLVDSQGRSGRAPAVGWPAASLAAVVPAPTTIPAPRRFFPVPAAATRALRDGGTFEETFEVVDPTPDTWISGPYPRVLELGLDRKPGSTYELFHDMELRVPTAMPHATIVELSRYSATKGGEVMCIVFPIKLELTLAAVSEAQSVDSKVLEWLLQPKEQECFLVPARWLSFPDARVVAVGRDMLVRRVLEMWSLVDPGVGPKYPVSNVVLLRKVKSGRLLASRGLVPPPPRYF